MIELNVFNPLKLDTLKQAHPTDSGYDLVAASDPVIVGRESYKKGLYYSIDYIEYDTGIAIEARDCVLEETHYEYPYCLVYPRSSLSKYNLTLCNSVGVIDNSYRGSIKVRFQYHFQPDDLAQLENHGMVGAVNFSKIYRKGDKIAQLIPVYTNYTSIKFVDSLSDTARGGGGFGSSGK